MQAETHLAAAAFHWQARHQWGAPARALAVVEYKRALELTPQHVGAREQLVQALREMGRVDEAAA